MDDEEEDMSLQRPVSQCWGTPFREIKFHDRESRDRADTQDRSTQTSTGPNAIVPRSEGHNIMVPQGHNNNFPCGVQDNHQSRILFHDRGTGTVLQFKVEILCDIQGNAGFRLHFPARFEPMDDRGERRREDEERRRMEERPEEERVEDSAEARIGRKLREIGDQFHQEHVQLFLRHQRDVLPVWIRLTMALYGFLFNREAPAVPHLRGQER
ncbi:bcl-2-modifying factor-like [Oncorhynchus clarkii lewisi]|uniref:bcl-2-modifying factor-like n=1 Tax=Oncorhynchus clarkii lewisi TaxID=490388 RepID=UPI0039B8D71D